MLYEQLRLIVPSDCFRFIKWVLAAEWAAISLTAKEEVSDETNLLSLDWTPELKMNDTDFFFGNERLLYLPKCRTSLLPSNRRITSGSTSEEVEPFWVDSLQVRTSGGGPDSKAFVALDLRLVSASEINAAATNANATGASNTTTTNTGASLGAALERARAVFRGGFAEFASVHDAALFAGDAFKTALASTNQKASQQTDAAADNQTKNSDSPDHSDDGSDHDDNSGEDDEPTSNSPPSLRTALVLGCKGDARVRELLDTCAATLSRVDDGSVHLFRTPADTTVKPDKWWHKKYPKQASAASSQSKGKSNKSAAAAASSAGGKKNKKATKNNDDGDADECDDSNGAKTLKPSEDSIGKPASHDVDPYSAYRATIDGLIVQRVNALIQLRANKVSGRVNTLVGDEALAAAAAAETAPELDSELEEDGAWAVAELCGGDGSLAARLLSPNQSSSSEDASASLKDNLPIHSYTLLERNKALLAVAKERQLTCPVSCEAMALVPFDAGSSEGQATMANLPHVDLWLASGSVLCGQVGSPSMAEPTLLAMVASLKTNGYIVITGFTGSFLTPQLLDYAKLAVRHASLPSGRADGLDTDGGLFHMWVLQKL